MSARAPATVACASCKKPILEGARKCKHCKGWQPDRPRAPRAAIMMFITMSSVLSVIVTTQESLVGSAPPLTALAGDATASEKAQPATKDLLPPSPATDRPKRALPKKSWKVREIKLGDAHPLDVCFSKDGASMFVSMDDASLREIRVATGEIVHKASLPVKGDRLVPLGQTLVAALNSDPRVSTVPVFDVSKWDRDPVLLEVGAGPTSLVEMSDGSVIVGGSGSRRVSRFALPSGRVVDDISLPQASTQLFLLETHAGIHLAALGGLSSEVRSEGAWMDIFDPRDAPFGASRRSVAIGRDPRRGSATRAGNAIFFPDFAANTAKLVDVGEETRVHTVDVGQGPIAAFVLREDLYGVTLNATARTATTVDLPLLAAADKGSVTTLMLPDEPRRGALSPDRSLLFVTLGGPQEPARGRGVVVIGGEPPEILATLETSVGVDQVTVSPDNARAAIATYFAKSITLIE
jgi:hypothetical protein